MEYNLRVSVADSDHAAVSQKTKQSRVVQMKHTRRAQLTSLISAALMTMAGAAYAEQTEQDSGAEDENVLEEVVVTAQSFRDSLRSSIATKENASQIVDAITAEGPGALKSAPKQKNRPKKPPRKKK